MLLSDDGMVRGEKRKELGVAALGDECLCSTCQGNGTWEMEEGKKKETGASCLKHRLVGTPPDKRVLDLQQHTETVMMPVVMWRCGCRKTEQTPV